MVKKRGGTSLKQLYALTAAVFSIVTLLHFWRAINNIDIIFGTWQVPIGLSWFVVVFAGFLAISYWRLLA